MIGILVVILLACLAFAIVVAVTAHTGLAVIAFLVVLLLGLYFGLPDGAVSQRWRR